MRRSLVVIAITFTPTLSPSYAAAQAADTGWVTIDTMILPTGLGVNAVKFKPAGLQFQTAAALKMSYANCSLLGKLLPKRIAYTTDNLQILYYLLSLDNLLSKYVTGQVKHFSDYVVAW